MIFYDILWYPISIHLNPWSPCFGVFTFGTLSFWPGLSFTWLSRASSSWELKKANDEEDDVDPGGMSRGRTSSIFCILHACTFFKLPAFLHESQLPALGCFGHFRATVQQPQKLIEMSEHISAVAGSFRANVKSYSCCVLCGPGAALKSIEMIDRLCICTSCNWRDLLLQSYCAMKLPKILLTINLDNTII